MDATLYLGTLALVGLAAMVGIGLLLAVGGRSANARRRKAAPPPPAPAPRVAVVAAGEGAPLQWLVGGRSYATPNEVVDPAHRVALQAFQEKLRATLPTLDGVAHAAPPTAPAEPLLDQLAALDGPTAPEPPPAVPEPDAAPPPRPAPRTYEEELQRPFVERLRASFFNGSPRPSPTTRLETMERLAQPAMPRLEALDELLQERLRALPDTPHASIRPASNGLLEIAVAGQRYDRIDDVPHEAIRAAMRDAVRQWERGI